MEAPVSGDFRVANNNLTNLQQLDSSRRKLEKDLMDWRKISDAVNLLDSEWAIKDVVTGILQRIQKETTYLQDWEKLGIMPVILSGYESGYIEQIDANFVHRLPMPREWVHPAYFEPKTRTITLISYEFEKPKKNLLKEMANTGFLDPTTEGLDHEARHALQFLYRSRVRQIILSLTPQGYLTDEELMEAQNCRSGLREDVNKRQDAVIRITDTLAHKRGFGEYNQDKIAFGVVAVDQLKALGVGIEDVTRLVADPGKWDKEKRIYPKIQQVIVSKMGELGLDNDGMKMRMAVYDLERDIERLKSKRIAQEEIRKALRKFKKSKLE